MMLEENSEEMKRISFCWPPGAFWGYEDEDDEAIGEPLKDADGSREALRMKEKIR